jgi:hypothetical protein
VVIEKEIVMYACGDRKFRTLRAALTFAKTEFVRTGVVLGIEPVVVLNKTPGYIAYLANGMKL